VKSLIVAILILTSSIYAKNIWSENPNFKGINKNGVVRFNDFSKLAKILSPTVANLQVEVEVKRSRNPYHVNDPMHRFFDHFFDAPKGSFKNRGIGSGVIITKDGYILTNNHVIEYATTIKVTLLDDDKVYTAKIIGRDTKTDLALLKIEADKDLPFAYLGNSNKLEIGEWVVAIGNPFGLQHTVTTGIVSAKERKEVHPGNKAGYHNFIQTDASINPGNSGGPLFNLKGEIIGINTAISAAGQGIGFAIPINMAKKVISHILKYGEVKRAWLGVTIQEVSKELAESFKMKSPSGALVTYIVDDSPSQKSGIKVGDVILKFNNKKIKKSSDLPWLASMAEIDKESEVQILRNGKVKNLKIIMKAMPTKKQLLKTQNNNKSKNRLGLTIREIPRKYNIFGVLVERVKRNSISDNSGILKGDIIFKINDYNIKNIAKFNKVVKKLKKNEVVRLFIKRGNQNIFIGFRL